MPFFSRKRKRNDGADDAPPAPDKKKSKKVFELSSPIGYKEGASHVLHLSLPDKLQESVSKELVSLLNTNGGIICFGVTKDAIVRGNEISRKEEDLFKCIIDEAVKRVHPMVEPSMYRVSFTPVVDKRGRETRYKILEIRVNKGDRFQIYETGVDIKNGVCHSNVYVRNGTKLSNPLTPHQIKDRIIDLIEEKIRYQSQLAGKLVPSGASNPSVSKLSNTETNKKKKAPSECRTPLCKIDKNKIPKNKLTKNHVPIDVIDLTKCEDSDESPLPTSVPVKASPCKSKVKAKLSTLVSGIKNKAQKLLNPWQSTNPPPSPKKSGLFVKRTAQSTQAPTTSNIVNPSLKKQDPPSQTASSSQPTSKPKKTPTSQKKQDASSLTVSTSSTTQTISKPVTTTNSKDSVAIPKKPLNPPLPTGKPPQDPPLPSGKPPQAPVAPPKPTAVQKKSNQAAKRTRPPKQQYANKSHNQPFAYYVPTGCPNYGRMYSDNYHYQPGLPHLQYNQYNPYQYYQY